MAFTSLLADAARLFEAIGAVVLVVGLVWSVVVAGITWRATGGRRGYQALRETFGSVLLLGLEILVAADLITTVAVAPTPRNVAVLGLIVLIRTFLSVSLQVEIDGRVPWRRFVASEAAVGQGAVNPTPSPLVTLKRETPGNETCRGSHTLPVKLALSSDQTAFWKRIGHVPPPTRLRQ
jgi:uncharacterized membrane protein